MIDKCPTCERDFQEWHDYPLIYLAKFERIGIRTDITFPFLDLTLIVGPNENLGNERPPQEVLEFFKANKKQKNYFHNGWKWSLNGEWDIGPYVREQLDQKPIIVAKLNLYLDTLDSLVGKEVEKLRLLPDFERDGDFRYVYNIPDTAYQLMFEEQERTPRGLRVAELHISGGDVMGEHLSLAIVGCLEYEGRLR